jgi:hypothetical protein
MLVSDGAPSAEQVVLDQDGNVIVPSNLQEVSVEGYETVRFARAINDGISNGYPPIDVLAEAFCRHGTGHALVEVQAEARSPVHGGASQSR